MKYFKGVLKVVIAIILLPFLYGLIALILSYITVNSDNQEVNKDLSIYLNTNGVHLDVIIPVHEIFNSPFDTEIPHLQQIYFPNNINFMAIGWGDENFYLNTPTWADLTFRNAIKALFLKSPTLLHISPYQHQYSNWVEVKISQKQFNRLIQFIDASFLPNEKGKIQQIENASYSTSDRFYKSKGSYSCFNTCNTWVNSAFKASGLKAIVWTPFDFPLLHLYEKED